MPSFTAVAPVFPKLKPLGPATSRSRVVPIAAVSTLSCSEEPEREPRELREPREPRKVGKRRRKYLMQLEEVKLESFLKLHGFEDVSDSKSVGWWWKDTVAPIHVAAKLGDSDMLRRLLNQGVAADAKTSRGKSALQLAMKHNKGGSHVEVIALLRQPVIAWSARKLRAEASEASEAEN
eukprot:s3121_g2.t1